MATTNAANEGSGTSRPSLSPSTPIAEVIGTSHGGSDSQASGTTTIAVGVNTQLVLLKLAEKIWRKELIDLNELLPARLQAILNVSLLQFACINCCTPVF